MLPESMNMIEQKKYELTKGETANTTLEGGGGEQSDEEKKRRKAFPSVRYFYDAEARRENLLFGSLRTNIFSISF